MNSLMQLRTGIEELVTYCWDAELKDFAQHCMSDEGRHIFRTLVRLDNFIHGTRHSAIGYVNEVLGDA